MSGPSATAKPMSAKIAVISSITWLIGWMRPVATGASRTGKVTSSVSEARRAASPAAQQRAARRQRLGDPVLQGVERRTPRLALLGGHAPEGREQGRDRALLAERRDAHGLERRLALGGADLGQHAPFEVGFVDHGSAPSRSASFMAGSSLGVRARPGVACPT